MPKMCNDYVDMKLKSQNDFMWFFAGQIQTLLREPRLEAFYMPPKHDLKLNFDLELREEQQEDQVPWPDTDLLFGEDPEYQKLIKEITDIVSAAVEEVYEYTNVRFHLVRTVHSDLSYSDLFGYY